MLRNLVRHVFVPRWPHYMSATRDLKKITIVNIDPCKFCKGQGMRCCTTCQGLTRIYEGEKEYKCDDCRGGTTICTFCGGSGKSHQIF